MTASQSLRLAIDCSTEHLALALVDDTGVTVVSRAREVGRMHAALLTLELTELFTAPGAVRTAVKEVRVGVGPGSYTGVRVAVAAAKGISRAWNVPVAGVHSLIAQLGDGAAIDQRAVVTRDAHRGNVYAQPCVRRQGVPGGADLVVGLGAPVKVPLDSISAQFPGWLVVAAGVPDAAVLAATTDTVGTAPLYL